MKLRLFALLTFLSIKFNNFAQTSPDSLFKSFFVTIQKDDTAGFVQHFITSFEISTIIKIAIPESINQDSLNRDPLINSKEYNDMLTKHVLHKVQSKADSLNINFRHAEYIGCSYQIIKDPQFVFISLNGRLFFKVAQEYFELIIEEAIWINEKWKITKIASLTALSSDSILLKKPQKLSAFNSLNFEIKLTDIQVMSGEKHPPPPPPPPKKMKK
jgi:hypothetical protein